QWARTNPGKATVSIYKTESQIPEFRLVGRDEDTPETVFINTILVPRSVFQKAGDKFCQFTDVGVQGGGASSFGFQFMSPEETNVFAAAFSSALEQTRTPPPAPMAPPVKPKAEPKPAAPTSISATEHKNPLASRRQSSAGQEEQSDRRASMDRAADRLAQALGGTSAKKKETVSLPSEIVLPTGTNLKLKAVTVPINQLLITRADLDELKADLFAQMREEIQKMKAEIIRELK
ncbi:hypothetical protein KIPB_006211, partial [Kipferlia bialata]